MSRPSCPDCCQYPRITKSPYLGESQSGYRQCPKCNAWFTDDTLNKVVDSNGKPVKSPFNIPSNATKKSNFGDGGEGENPGGYMTACITFNPKKKPSLAYCLKELGAPAEQVLKYRSRLRYNCNASYNDENYILSDLQNSEILDWAEYLYKEKLKKYHPDLHLENQGMYIEYCQYLGEMINRVRRIIYGRS